MPLTEQQKQNLNEELLDNYYKSIKEPTLPTYEDVMENMARLFLGNKLINELQAKNASNKENPS